MNSAVQENTKVWEGLYSQGKNLLVYPNDSFVRLSYGLLNLKDHPRILDYGCGGGANLLHLARRGFTMSGAEVSPSAIDACKARCVQEGINADFKLITENQLPYPDGAFDAVVAWQVLYYNTWDTFFKAIREIERVLRPGGVFIGTMAQPGDVSHLNSKPLGNGEYISEVSGQEGARLLIVEQEDLQKCFPNRSITVGEFNYLFGQLKSRHFIITYTKPE